MNGKRNVEGKRPSRLVLDSFALLAYLEDEAGAADVKDMLTAAQRKQAALWMSVINLGEALYITEREQSLEAAHVVLAAVDQLPIEVVEADLSLTLDAAHLKAHHSISYADAFAGALAMKRDAAVVTGDPEFEKVESLVHIHWIPQAESTGRTSAK